MFRQYVPRGNSFVILDTFLVMERDLGPAPGTRHHLQLVEEGKNSPFKLVKHLKRLMLTGDIAGLRAFRDIKSNCLVV